MVKPAVVVLVVGLYASGKSTFLEVAKECGAHVIKTNDILEHLVNQVRHPAEFRGMFLEALQQEIVTHRNRLHVPMVVVESPTALYDGDYARIPYDHIVDIRCARGIRLARARLRDLSAPVWFLEAIIAGQPSDEEHQRMAEEVRSRGFSTENFMDVTKNNARILLFQFAAQR